MSAGRSEWPDPKQYRLWRRATVFLEMEEIDWSIWISGMILKGCYQRLLEHTKAEP
jgi:hypothetical protein